VEVSISGCGVAAGYLATAQPSCSHKYRWPQAKEYPSGLQPLTLISCKWLRQDRRILHHDLSNARLKLPLLLNTNQGIQATLAFINRTKVGTRKWHLGQDIDD
jgi:hypothetical protein